MAGHDEVDGDRRPGLLKRLRARLAARPDSEHEQALIRIGFTFVIALYIVVASIGLDDSGGLLWSGLAISFAALVLSVGVVAHILVSPATNIPRRIIGMLIDTGGVNAVMLVGGMTAAPFYPILLWIIFGHGFRFGRAYLFAASGTALVLFGLVVFINPEWRQVPALDVALIMALIVLPAYVSSLLGKLEQAIRHAEEANQAKSRFLAVMSHEFRTPLNAVIGLSDLLRRDENDDDRREMLGTVRTAAGTILGLVDAVLDVAKIEAGKFAIIPRPFDLHALVGIVRGMLEPQAHARGLRLRLVMDPAVPPVLSGDSSAIRQVLTNLIANALKFTEQGGVILRIAMGRTRTGERGVVFSVEDTGIGIPPELQERIFESFTQAEDSTNRTYGGTGLGLTIARELTELMGGRLALKSTAGTGTTFSLVLPLETASLEDVPPLPNHGTVVVLGAGPAARQAHAVIRAASYASQPANDLRTAVLLLRRGHGRRLLVLADKTLLEDTAELLDIVSQRIEGSVDIVMVGSGEAPGFAMALVSPANLDRDLPVLVRAALAPHQAHALDAGPEDVLAKHPARLLIAEDNLTNQQVARRILEAAGHEVVIVGSGQDAVDRIAVERFDLVLMDLNMPGMGGIEAMKLLRFTEDELPPVVALTADVTEATMEQCRLVGFADYAMKPIDAPILIRLIDRLMGHVTPARSEPEQIAKPAKIQPPSMIRPSPVVEQPRVRPILSLASITDPRSVLDRRKLEGLALLDQGDGFIDELIDTFVVEARELVEGIGQAVADGDVDAMRDHAHALRSSAAHVGATALFDVLLGWRGLDDAALLARGPTETQRLRLETDRAATGLNAWRAERGFGRISSGR